MYTRYALFFTPPVGPLDASGSSWLGWCARRAICVPARGVQIERAARYGFHGTLVAPFEPAAGADVRFAVRALAAQAGPVQLSALVLSLQHGFLALRPVGASADLNALAAACVRVLHPLRIMPGAQEIARRNRARLTERQRANLARWGYPYVMEDFNFHMTLSGRVKHDPEQALAKARAHFADVSLAPFVVDALTLMGERADGRFVQVERVALSGTLAASTGQ